MDTLKFEDGNDFFMSFEEDLLAFLKGCRRLVIAGMGNSVRMDDAVGGKVASKLRGKVPAGVELIDCGTTPENFSSFFKRVGPTHILFFDAVDMGKDPGAFGFVNEETLSTQSLSTHKQSVKVLFRILREGNADLRIGLVGIQPKNIEFGTGMSTPVKRGLNSIMGIVIKALGETCHEDH
jgi:hydrogenase 3 maturation protease